MNSVASRSIVKVTKGMHTQDGAGVSLVRLVGTPELPDVDPFLMLDHFGSDDPKAYIAGFPPHPHRGFETVSYMISGSLEHRDNKGGRGIVTDGGVQWMTAGRGVVHSEMPAQTSGLMSGFQLWLNLPAKDKMMAPWYRDIPAAMIPEFTASPGVRVKLIAGEWSTQRGPGPERPTMPFIADISLEANSRISVPVPDGFNGFVYAINGALHTNDDALQAGTLGVLSQTGALQIAASEESARVYLVAGKPLNEPIAKHGPFVMNTMDELRQAISDYQRGLF